ncbi:MAG: tRNA lysidine(34) synthetase TilS, partial [Ruminiclostridium sp.]
NGQTGARIDIPLGMMAVKAYNSIIFRKQVAEKHQSFEYKLKIPGNTDIEIITAAITTQKINFETIAGCNEFINKNKDVYTKFFDFGKLDKEKASDLVVRNRRDGDIFKPLNSNGTKKLKEYFIDNKIPREQRSDIPLIAINKEIIWIIGNKTSDNYKVTDNTNSVLMITFAYNK